MLGSYICVLWVLIMSLYMCVRDGRVYVCYGCERSCICVLGVLIMSLYMCVRGGHVYVC